MTAAGLFGRGEARTRRRDGRNLHPTIGVDDVLHEPHRVVALFNGLPEEVPCELSAEMSMETGCEGSGNLALKRINGQGPGAKGGNGGATSGYRLI